jgi:hypothetical protein
MANKRVLATSSGVYAVDDGKTVEVSTDNATSIDEKQAERLAELGKVTFVTNQKSADK